MSGEILLLDLRYYDLFLHLDSVDQAVLATIPLSKEIIHLVRRQVVQGIEHQLHIASIDYFALFIALWLVLFHLGFQLQVLNPHSLPQLNNRLAGIPVVKLGDNTTFVRSSQQLLKTLLAKPGASELPDLPNIIS